MLGTLIIAGIFYLIGAFISGKLVKSQIKTWKALLSSFMLFIIWLWFIHLFYEGNVPSTASSQVGLSTIMLFIGLRSDRFLTAGKKKKIHKALKGEAKTLFQTALEKYKTGNFHDAIEKLLLANELQPDNKIILIGLSNNYSKVNDFPKAVDYMEKAILSGYKNFDRIQTHEEFEELRKSKIFQEFVENGYKQKHE